MAWGTRGRFLGSGGESSTSVGLEPNKIPDWSRTGVADIEYTGLRDPGSLVQGSETLWSKKPRGAKDAADTLGLQVCKYYPTWGSKVYR